ncbi:MAG TPA: hypothetical protein PK142_02620 [bacterium]|nr:hypothetical protein [bacterium]
MKKTLVILLVLIIFTGCSTATYIITDYESSVVIENKTDYDLVIIVNSMDTLRIRSGEGDTFGNKGEKRINNSFEIYFTYKKKTRYKYIERVFTSKNYFADSWIIKNSDLF